MKYFDIVAGDVIIHPDALAIPCFNDIWKSHKKDIATRIIKYIVFNNNPNSAYVTSMGSEARKERLWAKFIKDEKVDVEMIEIAEKEYLELLNTLPLQMLTGIRSALEDMSESLKTRKRSAELSFKEMNEILSMAAKAENAIKSIQELEVRVRKDDYSSSKIKGGSEVGYYEIPR